ncbi:RidA family protein [Mesorhizobium sp. ASY16-5R]|uniref:RidA family protein n=1 Tax=Mesorhizobium sp. ASY16-5R TaxID=3445772 RepID=UPI003FA03666
MTGPSVIDRLAQAGIAVPRAVTPVANYVSCLEVYGPLLFVSGQGTRRNGVFEHIGKIGGGLSVEDGYAAARQCALNILAQVEGNCGLGRIRRVVKLTGFVNAAPDFTELPAVLNGASDLMVTAFGDAGRHARSAVGVATLPFGMAVEVEAIFSITETGAQAGRT